MEHFLLVVMLILKSSAAQTFTESPQNTTVCVGSDVIINCAYNFGSFIIVNWLIDDVRLTPDQIMGSPLYEVVSNVHNDATDIGNYSLRILRINTTTSFQCQLPIGMPAIVSFIGAVRVVEIPAVSDLVATDNCKYINTSWTMINETCQNAHYNVTLMAADVIIEGPRMVQDNSYDFTGNISTSNEAFSVVINAVNGLETSDSRIFWVPPPMMTDTIPDVVLNSETCVSKAAVQWNLIDDTPKCGIIQYTYTLMSESEIKNGMTSSTSQNFSNLAESTSYTFILNGTNRAENKTLCNVTILTLSMDEAIPEIRISSNTITSSMISISWETDSPIGCGMVQYEVMIFSVEYPYMMGPDDVPGPTTTFSDLNSSTTYNITIFAVNDVMKRIITVTLKTKGDGDDSSSTEAIVGGVVGGLAAVMVIIIVVVVIYIVYKKKSKVQQGPSKIRMEDTEKTPSPVDEPVAYATAEADKVKLGTGGITYADLDIEKGPAAPGRIFPQDKPTYGQVKPSN